MDSKDKQKFTHPLIDKVEREYLKILADNLRNGSLKLEEAKNHTREFLSLLPFSSFDDFKKKIYEFTLTKPLYQRIYLMILNYEEEIKTKNLLERMRVLIKENNFEEALKVVANK